MQLPLPLLTGSLRWCGQALLTLEPTDSPAGGPMGLAVMQPYPSCHHHHPESTPAPGGSLCPRLTMGLQVMLPRRGLSEEEEQRKKHRGKENKEEPWRRALLPSFPPAARATRCHPSSLVTVCPGTHQGQAEPLPPGPPCHGLMPLVLLRASVSPCHSQRWKPWGDTWPLELALPQPLSLTPVTQLVVSPSLGTLRDGPQCHCCTQGPWAVGVRGAPVWRLSHSL